MTTALVLGGANCVWEDVEALGRNPEDFDAIVACNEIGIVWPHRLDAWVSLHGRKFRGKTSKWIEQREANGHPEALSYYAHPTAFRNQRTALSAGISTTPFQMFNGQASGSSGLFAVKVALIDMGIRNVILCGIPINPAPHETGKTHWTGGEGKKICEGFRVAWRNMPKKYQRRITSMSGWTRETFGAPGLYSDEL